MEPVIAESVISAKDFLSALFGFAENALRTFAPLEYFGAIASAITGVLAANHRGIDTFGVIVLGFVTAVAGGTIRDICLGVEVWWVQEPSFTLSVVLTSLIMFFVLRIWRVPLKFLDVADAFALALFTVIGVWKTIEYEGNATNAVTMGVITGVSGGIVRDVLLGKIPKVLRPGIYLYATASIVGGIVYVIVNKYDNKYTWLISSSVILALRLCAIRWKLSLPEFQITHSQK